MKGTHAATHEATNDWSRRKAANNCLLTVSAAQQSLLTLAQRKWSDEADNGQDKIRWSSNREHDDAQASFRMQPIACGMNAVDCKIGSFLQEPIVEEEDKRKSVCQTWESALRITLLWCSGRSTRAMVILEERMTAQPIMIIIISIT